MENKQIEITEEDLHKILIEKLCPILEKQYQEKTNNYIKELNLDTKITFKITDDNYFDIFAMNIRDTTFEINFTKYAMDFIMKISKQLDKQYVQKNLFIKEDNISNFIFAVIIDFIYHHEFTHIVRGHFLKDREDFFENYLNIDLLEEVDADFYATLFTIIFAEKKSQYFNSDNEILYHTVIFQSIIKFFDEINSLNPKKERENHPLPLERIIYFNNLYLFAIQYKKSLVKNWEGLKKSFLINLYTLIKDNPKYTFNKKEIDELWLEYSKLTDHIDLDLLRI